ncbi:transposase [Chitinophaga sancti]|nr:transposase [Chitinophaga sancti]WQD59610.1 transposase [Chitinophaga sancti]
MSESAANINYKELYEASIMMVQQLNKSLEQQQKSNQSLQDQVTQLQYQLQQLTKLLKGFKSERFLPSAVSNLQPELGFNAELIAPATNLSEVKKISYTKTKIAGTNIAASDDGTRLPDHLRRETTILEPTEDVSDCVKVGEEVRETLSWKPGEIFVNRTVVNVYRRTIASQKGKEVIIKASLPVWAINRCLADPALLAQITVDKLVDHKPLNRQIEAFKRNGVIIPYSTMGDWVGLVAKALMPPGTIHLKEMYKYNYWHADETGIAVLDRTKQKETHKGYFWTFLMGDSKMIYYDYQPGRGGERPLNILKAISRLMVTLCTTSYH